jgi:hypothetical protein
MTQAASKLCYDIFGLVVGQGAILLAAGLRIGLGASFICARQFSSLLFGISAQTR